MKIKRIGILIALALLVVLYFLNRADIVLVRQDKFEIYQLSAEGYELKSLIHLDNPNLLSSTVETIRQEFRVDGVVIGIFEMELNQGIPGRKETVFPVSIRFGNDAISSSSPDSSTRNVEVEVKSKIAFHNFIGGGTIQADQNYSVTR
ncbi:MAG: hypothetical protein IPP77_00915 [Bacteroidetes bacterium]|nr:hypothetical protein [Bacteroidota bacterium]